MTLPSVCVALATFQSERTIGKCLASLREQQYPPDKIKIIAADGGSTDQTLSFLKKYDVEIIRIPLRKQSAEYNKGVAVRAASGDLLLMLDHDNVLPHKNWLNNMVQPFLDNKNMVAAQTLRYAYDPSLSLLDRYCALFGASDPVVYYLKKCDRLPWFGSDNIQFGETQDKGPYYAVTMNPEKIPTLGANGCLINRELLFQHANISAEKFFHIDVHVDLILKGFDTYAFTKDTILHLTSYKELKSFLWRRKLFLEQFYLTQKSQRRYVMYRGPQDFPRLLFFILAASTLVWPTLEATRGYARIRDRAWFLHPIISLALLGIYSFTILKKLSTPHPLQSAK